MSVLEFALWCLFVVVIIVEALRLLTARYSLKHQHRLPRGQFKITMPSAVWDKQAAQGAFAVAVTDKEGQVLLTVLVQKEAKKRGQGGSDDGR